MFELITMVNGDMIQEERIKYLNDSSKKNGSFVIYWMQQSQRVRFNHVLQYAVKQANNLNLPIIVYFGLTDKYPEANRRHYQFMIEGLKLVQKELSSMGINFVLRKEDPSEGIIELADESRLIIVDRGYTRIQRKWRSTVAENIDCPLIQVESDVVIPIETTSQKEEYAAYTIRPKIHQHLHLFLNPLRRLKPKISSLTYSFHSKSLSNTTELLNNVCA
jgi:deoxyribodipyrimidine photo-lyase